MLMSTALRALVSIGCLVAAATAAPAQTYPTKPITIVVTAAAGGVSDVVARAIGQRLSEAWGQQVLIENKGGAAHVLGAAQVAKADPDGHTLMLAEAGTYVINPVLYPKDKLPYELERDFVPITGLIRIHHALIANPALPANNMAELIALAKQKPESITYGTAGIGSGPHVNFVRLENAAGVKFTPVHYRGATPALNDVMGNHTSMMMISVSSALPPKSDGRVKMLAIGSSQRLPRVPDVPTIAEGAGLPGFRAGTWFGLAATGGTPKPVVDKINAEVRRILDDPGFRQRFLEPQIYESMATSPEEFLQYIRSEMQVWAKVIREQKLSIGH
jgi:tripartite-type tricarboxylate transporter receptor subunit TctC